MSAIERKNPLTLIVYFFGFIVSCISYFDVRISVFLLVSAYFTFVANSKPWLPLALFIMITPLSNIDFLDFRIGGIPGLDLANIFLLTAVAVYLLSKKNMKLYWSDILMVSIVIILQVIAFARSIPYLYLINSYQGTSMTVEKFIMSHLFKPITFLFPFVIIVGYFRQREQVILLHKIIIFSTYILSFAIILTYFLIVPDKTSWEITRNSIGKVFGLHSNDIAIFYIISYPLILVNFLKNKNVSTISCLTFNLLGIGLLYSRTAYVLVAFCTIIFFLIEKNKKWLVAACSILILVLSFSGETIKERLMSGLEQGDISTISAGRVNQIWPAALAVIQQDSKSLLLGTGRYSIIYTGKVQKGHPHNMYLEAILDSGVIGLVCFLAVFITVMRKYRRSIPQIMDQEIKLVLKACFVSLLIYLISGISGRHFFPHLTNSYLWVVMALGLAATNLRDMERMPQGKRCFSLSNQP